MLIFARTGIESGWRSWTGDRGLTKAVLHRHRLGQRDPGGDPGSGVMPCRALRRVQRSFDAAQFHCARPTEEIHPAIALFSRVQTMSRFPSRRWLRTLLLVAALSPSFATTIGAATSADPDLLTSGVPVGPYSEASGSMIYFRVPVAAGATRATFVVAGGPGDCDLYVRYAGVPSRTTWDYRPYTGTSNETVIVASPAAGDWFVMLRAYSAYAGVTLRATVDAPVGQPVAVAPVFSPAPGTYSGQVGVSLSTTTPFAVIRTTTDGSTPTELSENFTAAIQLTATTTIKAVAFAVGFTPSPVATATYVVEDAVRNLENAVPVPNLSGARSSVANFAFAVPAGQSRATFTINGGAGDCDIYVKYGRLATTSVWDRRPYTATSNESVVIDNPAAGDWFVMLHGYSAYSGVTLTASCTGAGTPTLLPDLIVRPGAFNPRITTETFAATDCEVQEGIVVAGTRRLLRFTLETRNVGPGDLVMGDPATNPRYSYAPCHGHYHFAGFARYRLLSTGGQVVRTGQKVGFCLEDLSRWDRTSNPAARYSCDYQGIQAGWSDIYASQISGQWIDITGLAPGTYVLEATVDPTNVLPETDETNNSATRNVTIP